MSGGTDVSTTFGTTYSQSGVDANINEETFALAFDIVTYIAIGGALSLVLFAIVFHSVNKRYSSNVNYISILIFFSNIGDFWTDIILAGLLIYDKSIFWYFAVATLIVSYFLQCFICVRCVHQWSHIPHLHEYFQRFTPLIYAGTVFIGFHATIALCESKLFFLDCFHLCLKKEQTDSLTKGRFIAILLFEVCCVVVCVCFV